MATIVFSTIGGLAGGLAGGPFGSAVGQAAGALGGAVIDRALFSPSDRESVSASPGDIHVQTSTEGAHILEAFGTIRTAGQIIWATSFQKHQGSSGQGKGSGRNNPESYYTVSLAIGLGLGELNRVQRIFADGQTLDTSSIIWRFYSGAQDQEPDPLIERMEGVAPAYRGIAYVVFEDLDLSPFGNRLPQFSFEITRNANPTFPRIRAVTIIPGATELGYHPVEHFHIGGTGSVFSENKNTDTGKTDWNVALDQLEESCPFCESVSLVVAWFGSSLDLGACTIRPKSITGTRYNKPSQWRVGGLLRDQVEHVSMVDERPAFGGTPSDHSVIAAIKDLKKRGYKVMLHPFIMMDINPGFPWRGLISPGSENGSTQAASEVSRFFGYGFSSRFSFDEENQTISFSGLPNDWGLRRFILHYAHLCKAAGGVDAFLVGSELGGVMRTYSSLGTYPAVSRLRTLAREVKSIIPNAKISYGANWDEYRGHKVAGRPDFYFNLDPFWSSSSVDFVGINYYMPLADWRDGSSHTDLTSGTASSIYDLNYLRNNIKDGEGYSWFYANSDDRETQNRTRISDSAYGKPWVFAWKDISSWWNNSHYDRPNGVESGTATSWVKGMKPIWFTETGCPAVDKGANQPNVFIDLSSINSVSSRKPYYSSGARDDYMQNRYLEAILTSFDENHPNHLNYFNVKVNDVRMVSPENMFIWCWDARPYPYFPNKQDLWTDGVNWAQGHWITGRTAYTSVPNAVAQLMDNHAFKNYDTSRLRFNLKGFRVDRVSSLRDMLDPLMRFYFFDAVEREGIIHFIHRDQRPVAEINADECVPGENGEPGYQLTRLQETELPKSVKLVYTHEGTNHHQAVAEARRLTGASNYIAEARLPIVASQDEAIAAAQRWLHETLIARERAILRLPLSRLALEPGDVITFICSHKIRRHMRIINIQDGNVRIVEAVATDPSIYHSAFNESPIDTMQTTQISPPPRTARASSEEETPEQERQVQVSSARILAPERDPMLGSSSAQSFSYGPPWVEMMDLPHLRGDEALAPHIAIHADPRPNAFAVYRSITGQYGWQRLAMISTQPTIGIIETPFNPGVQACWDEVNHFRVRMMHGVLISRSKQDVLAGANYAAIQHSGGWEIIQFRHAELTRGEDQDGLYYNISSLLRALAGTDAEMHQKINSGAAFVLLDPAHIPQLNLTPVERGVSYHWRVGPAGQPYSAAAYQPFEYRYLGINLRPLSPAHLRAQRMANGDIIISWMRRTRDLSDDGWGEQDVPLGEAHEAYEVDILKDGQIMRSISTEQPRLVYAAAQQRHDFAMPLNQLSVCAYQISAVFGRGTPAKKTFTKEIS